MGLASLKLSGSINRKGLKDVTIISVYINNRTGGMSLNVKNGWNVTLDRGCVVRPMELLAPFSWINTICRIVMKVSRRGSKK